MSIETKSFINNFCKCINNLKSENLTDLEAFYSPDCYFTDPFHKIYGSNKVIKVYKSMFDHLKKPKFEIITFIEKKNVIIFKWNFKFCLKSKIDEIIVPGLTWIELNESTLIEKQEDYWDSCELFNKFFILKYPLNWIKSRISTI